MLQKLTPMDESTSPDRRRRGLHKSQGGVERLKEDAPVPTNPEGGGGWREEQAVVHINPGRPLRRLAAGGVHG